MLLQVIGKNLWQQVLKSDTAYIQLAGSCLVVKIVKIISVVSIVEVVVVEVSIVKES